MVRLSSLRPRSSVMHLPPVRNGDVLEHGLAAVAEAGGLDGAHIERAADLVHDEGGEGFALDFLGDDQEGLAALGDNLEEREELLQVGNLLLVDEHVGVLEDGFLALPRWSRSRARGSPCRTACPRRRRAWSRWTWPLRR
jgi:hypothetical protein